MIKLVAVDLDDTLLDHTRKVSPRTKEAIAKAISNDVIVTLATGRMYRSALPYAIELKLDIPLITYNGALIKYSLSGETLFHCPLDKKNADAIMTLFQERGWYIQTYIDDVLYVKERNENALHYEDISGIEAIPLGEALYDLSASPTKLLAVAEPEQLAVISSVLKANFGDKIYLTTSKPRYLEIMNPDANKGLALAFMANHFGVNRQEVMAIGDSHNDLDMIKYAGWGVAMNNARDDVKQAAAAVTGSNDADGVAEAIEKYVLLVD